MSIKQANLGRELIDNNMSLPSSNRANITSQQNANLIGKALTYQVVSEEKAYKQQVAEEEDRKRQERLDVQSQYSIEIQNALTEFNQNPDKIEAVKLLDSKLDQLGKGLLKKTSQANYAYLNDRLAVQKSSAVFQARQQAQQYVHQVKLNKLSSYTQGMTESYITMARNGDIEGVQQGRMDYQNHLQSLVREGVITQESAGRYSDNFNKKVLVEFNAANFNNNYLVKNDTEGAKKALHHFITHPPKENTPEINAAIGSKLSSLLYTHINLTKTKEISSIRQQKILVDDVKLGKTDPTTAIQRFITDYPNATSEQIKDFSDKVRFAGMVNEFSNSIKGASPLQAQYQLSAAIHTVEEMNDFPDKSRLIEAFSSAVSNHEKKINSDPKAFVDELYKNENMTTSDKIEAQRKLGVKRPKVLTNAEQQQYAAIFSGAGTLSDKLAIMDELKKQLGGSRFAPVAVQEMYENKQPTDSTYLAMFMAHYDHLSPCDRQTLRQINDNMGNTAVYIKSMDKEDIDNIRGASKEMLDAIQGSTAGNFNDYKERYNFIVNSMINLAGSGYSSSDAQKLVENLIKNDLQAKPPIYHKWFHLGTNYSHLPEYFPATNSHGESINVEELADKTSEEIDNLRETGNYSIDDALRYVAGTEPTATAAAINAITYGVFKMSQTNRNYLVLTADDRFIKTKDNKLVMLNIDDMKVHYIDPNDLNNMDEDHV